MSVFTLRMLLFLFLLYLIISTLLFNFFHSKLIEAMYFLFLRVMVVTEVKMFFVILKMNGNLTLQMLQFLHFLEGGNNAVVVGFVVLDI